MEKNIKGCLYSYKEGQGELVEKKSRFIATVRPVETEEEAVTFINETKKKYWDARHNCSAFVIGKNRNLQDALMMANRQEQQEDQCLMYF